MMRFVADGLVEAAEGDDRFAVLARRRARRAGTAEQPAIRGTPADEVAALRREVDSLQSWQARALRAEASLREAFENTRRRDEKLRRILAQALHPDAQSTDDAARQVMDRQFRELWPRLSAMFDE